MKIKYFFALFLIAALLAACTGQNTPASSTQPVYRSRTHQQLPRKSLIQQRRLPGQSWSQMHWAEKSLWMRPRNGS